MSCPSDKSNSLSLTLSQTKFVFIDDQRQDHFSFCFESTIYKIPLHARSVRVSCSIVDDLFNRPVVDIYRSAGSLAAHETLDEINHIIVDK